MSELAYIDDTGFHAPDYATVLEAHKNRYRAIYGDDIYLEPDSQDGAAVAAEALAHYDTILLAESVYNSFSPQTARGVGLSRMVKINGMRRGVSSHSTIPARCIGQPGTTIENGVIGGDNGPKWLLPEQVVIPSSGETTVTATCSEPGDYRAAKGEISRILTPTRGWQEASNTEAATPGAPVETDGTLRIRQTVSTALPSLSVLDGIKGAVASIKGVTRSEVYENDTDKTDANGISSHSIAVVVEGGDSQEIANAIAIKKTPGSGTYGTTSVLTTDKYGSPNTIRFFYRIPVRIRGKIKILAHHGYLAATGLKIIDKVVEYINGMKIGAAVTRSRLFCPITSAEAVAGNRTFDVDIDQLLLAANDDAFAPANIPIPFNAVATADADDFELVVVRE